MRGTKKLLITLAIAASMSSSARDLKSEKLSTILFPTAQCNVTRAMPTLKHRLDGRDLETEWDGDLPWPDVLGVWTNTSRDVYVTVGAREIPNAKWGHIHVTLRSICTDKILAQGAKIIGESDWRRDSLVVRLRNYGLNGTRLTALVKVSAQTCDLPQVQKKLEVTIAQSGIDGTENTLRDLFSADRF